MSVRGAYEGPLRNCVTDQTSAVRVGMPASVSLPMTTVSSGVTVHVMPWLAWYGAEAKGGHTGLTPPGPFSGQGVGGRSIA